MALLLYVWKLIVLFGTSWANEVGGGVLAPSWANASINPCAVKSWQLVLWPLDGQCHRLFTRGPCSVTFEIAWDVEANEAICRCPPGHLIWQPHNRCYPRYTRGPCDSYSYLDSDENNYTTLCRRVGKCAPGHGWWPKDSKCFPTLTRGPCPRGDLLVRDTDVTGAVRCGCPRSRLPRHFWSQHQNGGCYEHLSRGPCEKGSVFFFNKTSGRPQCGCDVRLPSYHEPSKQCHPLGSKGPCKKGRIFATRKGQDTGECRCAENHVAYVHDNIDVNNYTLTEGCVRLYSRGQCRAGHFIVPTSQTEEGQCVKNPCSRTQVFLHVDGFGGCFEVGRRGPCAMGQVVLSEGAPSQRGFCSCSPLERQVYWAKTGQCYETNTQGPCGIGQTFDYDSMSRQTTCVCDSTNNFIAYNSITNDSAKSNHSISDTSTNKLQCYQLQTQGPCGEGQWLVEGSKPFCTCRPGLQETSLNSCQPQSIRIAKFLNSFFH